MITLKRKKEVIEKCDICRTRRKSSSTTCAIIDQNDKILAVHPSEIVTRITKNLCRKPALGVTAADV